MKSHRNLTSNRNSAIWSSNILDRQFSQPSDIRLGQFIICRAWFSIFIDHLLIASNTHSTGSANSYEAHPLNRAITKQSLNYELPNFTVLTTCILKKNWEFQLRRPQCCGLITGTLLEKLARLLNVLSLYTNIPCGALLVQSVTLRYIVGLGIGHGLFSGTL